MAFAESSNTLYAVNAFTGELVWSTPINGTQGVARVGPTQIDNDYLLVDTGHNFQCRKIIDGTLMWISPSYYTGNNYSDVNPGGSNGGLLPGGPNYMAGAYSPDLKMKYVLGYNGVTEVIYAYDLSNPSQAPPLAWQYMCSDGGSEILCFGDGKLFVGGNAYRVYAIDGKTGDLLWMSPKVGYAGQMGVYSEGKVYVAGDSASLSCYDANDGTLLWDYYAGDRAFFAYAGTAAYGRYYQHNDQLIPSSFFACWDSQTGNMLWQQTAAYFIGYLAPVSADGKIFTSTSDGQGTTDQAAVPATFSCFDAFSGQRLWDVRLNIAFPAIAYGNVYGISGGVLYCIGSPQSWSMWRGNLNAPGVGQSATTNLTTPLWTYKTGAAITSSPAVADGKVYIGSSDGYMYAFGDIARQATNITATLNKSQVNTGETITVTGQLNPKLPNTTISVSFTLLGQPEYIALVSTDNLGAFSASYTPTAHGNYTITASYAGKQYSSYAYEASNSPVATLAVQGIIPTPTPESTATPSPTSTPLSTATPTVTITPSVSTSAYVEPVIMSLPLLLIAAAVVIIVIIVVIVAVVFIRRR